VCNAPIRAIATDETGAAWVGSSRGDVKCVRAEGLHADASVLGMQLRLLGALQHTGSGSPEVSASNQAGEGRYINKHCEPHKQER
jgi:hypothetical protein